MNPLPAATHSFTSEPVSLASVRPLAVRLLQAGDRVTVTRGGRRGESGTVTEMRGQTAVVKLDTLTLFMGNGDCLERDTRVAE